MSSIFVDQDHADNIQQCEREELCNVVLIAGTDEMRIPAHRSVLVASSKYFKGTFRSPMCESVTKEIKLSSLEGDTVKSLIDYCYTGRLVIGEDTVVELLKAADMLLLVNVVTACGNFLVERLDPSNCLGFAQFAERYHCQTLLQKAKDYCLDHFMDVSETEEFFNLNAEQLGELLACDGLCVPSENDVFKSLMSWLQHEPIEREKHKDELLRSVRMPLMDESFLIENVRTVCTSAESHHIYEEAIEWHTLPGRQILNGSKSTKLRKLRAQFLFAITQNLINAKKNIHCFCPQQLKWMKYSTNMNCYDFAVVVMEDNFYFIGGDSVDRDIRYFLCGNSVLNTAMCLNLQTMAMSTLSPMTERRKGCGAAVLNGFLYAVGGWNGKYSVGTVEKWNKKTNTWHEVASMSGNRYHFGTVCLGEKLYIIGGESEGSTLNTVECYDPDKNLWKTVAAMNWCRSCPGVSVANGLIYAVGGQANVTVECYNPEKNLWTLIYSLPDIFPESHALSDGYSSWPYRANSLSNPLCTTFCDKIVVFYKDCFAEYNDTEGKTTTWKAKSYLNGLSDVRYIFPYSDKILISEFAYNPGKFEHFFG